MYLSLSLSLESYVSTYEQLVKDEISSSTLVANPVDAYLLLKRLTIEWEVVEKVLQHEANSTIGELSFFLNKKNV